MSQGHRCDRYEISTLPGVTFCRKGGARIVGEMMLDLNELRQQLADREARLRELAMWAERLRVPNSLAGNRVRALLDVSKPARKAGT